MLTISCFSKLRIGLLSCLTVLFSGSVYADIVIQDSDGEKVFSTVPVRIASLGWELTEDIVELGLTPVAAPEIKVYEEWVKQPAIPEKTEDIGGRAEPNLEKLTQLKPDVILINSTLKDIQTKLEKIAPVVFFDTYRADHNNAAQADWVFNTLAKLFNKTELAQTKLKHRDEVIDNLKAQLETTYSNNLPKVATLRFANTTSVYLYGGNSMPEYALNKLGIKNAVNLPDSQWGVTQKRLKDLRNLQDDVVLYFEPFYEQDKLNQSPLWQAMPFVKNHKVTSIASTWTYGGAMSIQYLAEAMTTSLLSLKSQ